MGAPRAGTLLVVTRHPPLPSGDGFGAYLDDVLRFLALQGWKVEVGWLRSPVPPEHATWSLPADWPEGRGLRVPGAARVGRRLWSWGTVLPGMGARAKYRLKCLLAGLGVAVPRRGPGPGPAGPGRAAGWYAEANAGERELVRRWCRAVRPDAVLVCYAHLAGVLDAVPAGVATWCLASDILSERAAAEAGPDGPAVDAAREAAWLSRFGHVVAISGRDAEVMAGWVPRERLVVAPKSLSLPSGDPAADPGAGAGATVLFVGSGNAFNVEGLRWFVDGAWPATLARVPGARLVVAGDACRALDGTRPPRGAELLGRVADLAPLYRDASVVVVPLLRGTGVKIKLVEAAARGAACVVTPVALQGLEPFAPHVRVEGEARAFGEAVAALLEDPPARGALARGLHAAAREHLSPAACFGELARRLAARR